MEAANDDSLPNIVSLNLIRNYQEQLIQVAGATRHRKDDYRYHFRTVVVRVK